MSKKPPTLVQFTYSDPPKSIASELAVRAIEELEEPLESMDAIDSLVTSVGEEEEEEEEEPIKVVGKPDIDEKSIFSNYPDNLAVRPDFMGPEPSAKSKVSNAKSDKSDKSEMSNAKPKKPRKPMTEEHKAKLALAREKAMASRKAKAEERKKMKALENEEKELVQKQKVKRVQKLKEEVEGLPEKPMNSVTSNSGLTKKDLEEAQLEAIIKYEAMRKERKAKKKEEQIIEAEKQRMLNTIQRATGTYGYRKTDPSGRLMNRFDSCY